MLPNDNEYDRVPYFSLFKLKMIQSPDRGLTRTSELEPSAYAALRHMIHKGGRRGTIDRLLFQRRVPPALTWFGEFIFLPFLLE